MLRFSKLQFEIELLDNNAPMGFWGTRLRGGYGDILKAQLCQYPQHNACTDCDLFEQRVCEFPFLFKPHSRLFPEVELKKPFYLDSNVTAPFVFSGPPEVVRPLAMGSRITFEVVAIGPSVARSLRLADTLARLGDQGLDVRHKSGNMRKARFGIVEIRDVLGGGRSMHVMGNVSAPIVIDAASYSAGLSKGTVTNEIVIEFVSPVSHFAEDCPKLTGPAGGSGRRHARGLGDMYQFVRLLTRRIGILWQLYGHDWPSVAEFYRWQNRLLKASKGIEITEIILKRKRIARFSKSLGRSLIIDGFVGALRAEGDFSDLIEVLLLGELFHIGESTSYGLGQYKLIY